MHVTVKPRAFALVLAAVVTCLTLADAAVLWVKFRLHHDYLFGLTPFFDFNREGNLPAFYSACALLVAAGLFLIVAADARQRADRWYRHWLGLGLIFLYMAIDEAAEIHGLLTNVIASMVETSGPLLFAWVIPYALLTLLFGIVYVPFTVALPPRIRTLFVLAGVVFVAGALGMEMFGGAIVSAHGGVGGGGLEYWAHAVEYTIEEALEMAGIVLLIYALLFHIAAQNIIVTLRVVDD
ncbi:MAG TPA: hypothetical protein VL263_02370 [Vicinamibacterales bacterium]|nr:hypothetical protein [Vicinamibacterales bacterium]